MQKRVREKDVEAVGAARFRREVLEGVNAFGDVRVPLAVNGQSRYSRESQVERMNGELLTTAKHE